MPYWRTFAARSANRSPTTNTQIARINSADTVTNIETRQNGTLVTRPTRRIVFMSGSDDLEAYLRIGAQQAGTMPLLTSPVDTFPGP